jgi:type IV pilus assembly protein PilW
MSAMIRSRALPGRSRGLSLIELMVALTIGLALTLGLFTMISGSSQTFRIQDEFARMQEGATMSLRYVGDSVRHAGFFGYARDGSAMVNQGVSTVTDCGSGANLPSANWAIDLTKPVYGFDLTSLTVAANLPCINPSNFQDGPILVTRAAIGYRMPDPNADGNLSDGVAAQPNFATTVFLQADANGGMLFYGSQFAALRATSASRHLPNGNDVDVFQYSAHVYYIRPCSRPTGAGGTVCQATDDGGRPIPTLVRQELVGSNMVEVPLVEGVDRIDYRYGIDNTADGVPDTFTRSPAVADWANVVAVRVTVLMRSSTVIADYDDSGRQYDLNNDGTNIYTCNPTLLSPVPTACHYKRKVFSQVFQLRNIAQRRGA